ncbi:hypothetical protein [Mongoliitalea lutea]|nr:hypothetical protein [Mongoliitalea lutea]
MIIKAYDKDGNITYEVYDVFLKDGYRGCIKYRKAINYAENVNQK